jgi:hypothetical protein
MLKVKRLKKKQLILNYERFNTGERRVGIPLIDLTPPYLYACPKIVPGFPTKCGIVVFSELR